MLKKLTERSHAKLDAFAGAVERAIYLWDDSENFSVIKKSYEDRLDFLLHNDSWYFLYKGMSEDDEEEFDIQDESKSNEAFSHVVSNLLAEQKLYTEYFRNLADLNAPGIRKALSDLKNFLTKLQSAKGEVNGSQREVMRLLESGEGVRKLEELESKIKGAGKMRVSVVQESRRWRMCAISVWRVRAGCFCSGASIWCARTACSNKLTAQKHMLLMFSSVPLRPVSTF